MKIIIIYGTIFMLLAVAFESRSFFIGGVGAITVIYLLLKKPPLSIKIVLFCGYASLLLAIALIIKTDSSLGRILIYKVSAKMVGDHPWTGVGLGHFQRDYLLYQAAYFENQDFNEKELLLADNTHFAFNDYLQLVVERGLLVVVILMFYFVALGSTIKYAALKRQGNMVLIAIYNLIAIGVAAFFSPVFENKLWFVLFILSYFLIFLTLLDKGNILAIKYVIFALGLILVDTGIQQYRKVNSYLFCETTSRLAAAGFHEEALNMYQDAFSRVENNPWLQYQYGRYMLQLDKVDAAVSAIERSTQSFAFNYQYSDLGDCYHKLKQQERAEWYYRKSVCMVPNRFDTRYKLFHFYLETGQTEKAKSCAQAIVDLPVKVPSHRVSFIRGEAEGFLLR